jgi:hypothetical protein
MSKFERGEKVLVNRNVIAEVLRYDEETDNFVYVIRPLGGGTETVTAHISQTTIEPLNPLQEDAHVERVDVPVDGVSDEVTTVAAFASETPEQGDARVNATEWNLAKARAAKAAKAAARKAAEDAARHADADAQFAEGRAQELPLGDDLA